MNIDVNSLNDLGPIVVLLLLVISGLVWDRNRLLSSHKEMTADFINVVKESGEKYAQVVNENTKAFGELSSIIKGNNR